MTDYAALREAAEKAKRAVMVDPQTILDLLQRIEELERQNEDLEVVVDNLKTAEGNLWERAKRTDKRLAAAERVVELARDTFIPYKNKRDQFEELIAAYDAVVGAAMTDFLTQLRERIDHAKATHPPDFTAEAALVITVSEAEKIERLCGAIAEGSGKHPALRTQAEIDAWAALRDSGIGA